METKKMRAVSSRQSVLFFYFRFILGSLFIVLAGCASQPPVSDLDKNQYWETHKKEINTLHEWGLAGRMSVRLKNDAWSASLNWKQIRDSFNLRIIAPLAQGSVEIYGDRGSVNLKTGEDEVYTDRDVDQLMQEKLGWSVPISALEFWVRGVPEPGTTVNHIVLDNDGRLVEMAQTDWIIEYQSYTRAGGHALPSRLNISRDGIIVRLSINRWTTTGDN